MKTGPILILAIAIAPTLAHPPVLNLNYMTSSMYLSLDIEWC